jgi:hypothetical protein
MNDKRRVRGGKGTAFGRMSPEREEIKIIMNE